MDFTALFADFDRILAIIGLIAGFGGVTASYIAKLKIKEVLEGAKEVLDAVDAYGKYDDDKDWTDAEYKAFGQKAVKAIKRVEPVVRKLIKK